MTQLDRRRRQRRRMRRLRRYAGRVLLGLLILAMLSVLVGGLVLSCMPKHT